MLRELDIIEAVKQVTGQTSHLSDDVFFEESTRRIFTTDMLVEGQHFSLDYFSPQDLGWKAAAVNISDIAATGGKLKYLLVSLGLPAKRVNLDWIHSFYEGLNAACRTFGGEIVGGDTVGSEQLTINVTAIGSCLPGQTPGRRFNAQTGDFILCTGFHGLSAVGLQALKNKEADYEQAKSIHLRPMPRIEAGQMLARKYDRYALMDSSDGLADALIKIAQASQRKLIINPAKIPLHPEVLQYSKSHGKDPWQSVLYGGEDFELIATVPFLDDELNAHFRVIGQVDAVDFEPGAWMVQPDTGRSIALTLSNTFQHF